MAQPINLSATWYEATAGRGAAFAPLQGRVAADVCVIGGGLAGLTTALELQRAGTSVALLEAQRIAWGASGRNGGFVSSGFAEGMSEVWARIGREAARSLYWLSRQGTEYVRARAVKGGITMGQGMLVAQRHPGDQGLRAHRDFMARDLDEALDYLDRDQTRAVLRSERYFASLRKPGAFHIHPLRYALGVAEEASQLGARIFENSKALNVAREGARWRIATQDGHVVAQHAVHCVSSLDRRLHPFSGQAMLPVATYVAVTQPLEQDAIRTKAAISDTRRAGDYYRLIDEGRILWGGRITTQVAEPQRLAEHMRGDMIATYPQLAHARMEYAWAGLMGYALHKMPLIGRDHEGLWFATAFGGHGINTTAMAGMLLARAIAQGDDEYRRFSDYPPRWAGGPFGRAGVQGAYWWMQLRDGLAERKASVKTP